MKPSIKGAPALWRGSTQSPGAKNAEGPTRGFLAMFWIWLRGRDCTEACVHFRVSRVQSNPTTRAADVRVWHAFVPSPGSASAVLQDHSDRLSANHHAGRIGVPGCDGRHDGCVRDAQAVHTKDSQAFIDHGGFQCGNNCIPDGAGVANGDAACSCCSGIGAGPNSSNSAGAEVCIAA